MQAKSRWVAADWGDLRGFEQDAPQGFWLAWTKSCEKPVVPWVALCPQVRAMSLADAETQRAWLRTHLQPYRVTSPQGEQTASMTAYFEPMLTASRMPAPGFAVPLYRTPAGGAPKQAWFSRQDIDTVREAQAALAGRELMWLNDPIDALVLGIQGSGRVSLREPDGRERSVRVSFAGSNERPYQSVGRWLIEQGLSRDASWPGVKAWLAANPQRTQELLWRNPRVVFFKDETLDDLAASFGPRGAQGVPLSPGRSIAVDRQSIPLGTPVWLNSTGPGGHLQKLVVAQDTGSAIVGAMRLDYFVGTGASAGEQAGRIKQGAQMWALWPK